MQQGGGGGGGGTQSQHGEMTPAATTTTTAAAAAATTTTTSTHTAQQQPVESASPISSRPPAMFVTSNLDEYTRLSGGVDEDEGDRVGGVASGNRWPRQETLALLKIRSDMDAAFRDATVKGPLWEDVSRKLSELGYKRSAKKCKEKFENVHKYYKRTKEGRAGRQDGKSYKFFSQLEALHSSTSNVSMLVTTVTSSNPVTLDVAPVSVGIPMPISSARIPTSHSQSTLSTSMFPTDLSVTIPNAANIPGSTAGTTTTTPPTAITTTTNNPIGISFSSDSSSHETEDDDDEEEEMDFEGQPSNTVGSSHKRKRQSSSNSTTHSMMEFFESLMKQVMQKQETMQQRFLEAIEKREQERMIREEAWKRQEMARLAREQEVMAQERAISASRDAAIISFLQKITGQTIQLPFAVTIPAAPPPTAPPPSAPVVVTPVVSLPTPTQHHLTPPSFPQERQDLQNQQLTQSHHRHQQQQLGKSDEMVRYQTASISIPSQVVMAIPEQQIPPSQESGSGGSFESVSSRWPKVEVLALIKLRSGLEPRYQEAGPKGPLWEEISAGMKRIGYNRSAKRCKEKWENINKYFKKVKESNKKRPEDAKTCPYFHELDALYRKRILGGGSTSGGGGGGTSTSSFNISEEQQPQQHQQESLKLDPTPAATDPQESSNVSTIMPAPQLTTAFESDNKNTVSVNAQASNVGLPGSLFGEENGGASNKPEDIMKKLMNQQGMQQQQHHQPPQQSIGNDFDKTEESNIGSDSDNMDDEEDYDEDEDDDQDEFEEERKMAYKVEFQRQNTNASNGGGNGAASFLAMVQ